MSDDVNLRSNIAEVIDKYGTIIGAVPMQLLYYHVNNEERFEHVGFSEEQIREELRTLEQYNIVERTEAWRTVERRPRIKGRKTENFQKEDNK